MTMKSKLVLQIIKSSLLLWVFCALGVSVKAQINDSLELNYKKYTARILLSDSVLSLTDKFLMANSIHLYIDSIPVAREDYTADSRYGKILLSRNLLARIFSDTSKTSAVVLVYYRNFPFQIPDYYSRFDVLSSLDTLKKDTVQIAEVRSDVIEDIFAGTELEKSGSIFRGFTIGNNRDLTLNSGFRLQMNGKLAKDIEITAALTDERTPIQPEGNTAKLQELDKVFIELRSKNITTTLGDIDVNYSKMDFFNFSRRVQGAKGFAEFGPVEFSVSGALSRGTFNTNTFLGTDGVQGPYRLVGVNNEVNIVILAGSEKVYLDGILMHRGETNDYTIDYSNGRITFTYRRVVTNQSRITVDFQYTDRKYSRSLITGQTSASLYNDRLRLSFAYLRERDDPDKPIDFSLSDSDRVIIANAGNDRIKASKSGVDSLGTDSLGRPLGQYIAVDTTINIAPHRIYRYAPDSSAAYYQVTFSYVGPGKGDYNSLSTTTYQFSGIGQGAYLPIIFLPLPHSYQSGDLALDLTISKSLSLKVETAVSDFDRNLFSTLDDAQNKGLALVASASFNKKSFKLGKLNLGDIELTYKQRYINKFYNSLDRLNKVEYNRIWDIQDSSNQTENTSEGYLRYSPVSIVSLNAVGGRITRGDFFNSIRVAADIYLGRRTSDTLSSNIGQEVANVPGASYNIEYISSKDVSLDYKGLWIRQTGIFDWTISPSEKRFGSYNINLNFYGEDKQIRSLDFDTSSAASFRFYQLKPQLRISDIFKFDFGYRFIYRLDDGFFNGSLTRMSNSYTHVFSARVKNLGFASSEFDVTVYQRKYAAEFLSIGFGDNRTILSNWRTNFWFFDRGLQMDLFYRVSSERTPKLQIIFVKVPKGEGNYIWEDKNSNGVQEIDEFILVNYDGEYVRQFVPTDQLFQTTDLQSSAVITIAPSRIFPQLKKGILSEILKNISLDSYLGVNEKSRDPEQRNIYLMRLTTFQNEINTIAGSNTIRQDINLFETNQYFGLRLRYIQKKSFNQYYSGNERLLNLERSVRLRLSFTEDLALQTDFINRTDRNNAPVLPTRNRNIKANSVVSDLTYKPYRYIEVGFKAEITRANDFYPFVATQADINSQKFRFNYSIKTDGRLRIEVERDEALLNTNPLFVPYELTGGIVIGKSFLWTVSFDYRITNFIQAAVNYFGRAEGNLKVIHTGTAELRAFF
jgi:hypothetical protein